MLPPAFRCGGSCPAGKWPSRCRPRSESVSQGAECAARPVRRFVYTYSQCADLGPGPGEAVTNLSVISRATTRAELCSLRAELCSGNAAAVASVAATVAGVAAAAVDAAATASVAFVAPAVSVAGEIAFFLKFLGIPKFLPKIPNFLPKSFAGRYYELRAISGG